LLRLAGSAPIARHWMAMFAPNRAARPASVVRAMSNCFPRQQVPSRDRDRLPPIFPARRPIANCAPGFRAMKVSHSTYFHLSHSQSGPFGDSFPSQPAREFFELHLHGLELSKLLLPESRSNSPGDVLVEQKIGPGKNRKCRKEFHHSKQLICA